MKAVLFLIVIILVFVPLQVNATDASKTVELTDDAYVDSENPNSNFNGDSLKVKFSEANTIRPDSHLNIYIGFSIVLPDNASLTSIILEFNTIISSANTLKLEIYSTGFFDENTITYNNAPDSVLLLSSYFASGSGFKSISLNVDNVVISTDYYFMITTNVDSIFPYSFWSKDYSYDSVRPKVIISYDDPNPPADSSIPLLFVFLPIVAIALYRKKNS